MTKAQIRGAVLALALYLVASVTLWVVWIR
jgi:hypothetical protein